MYVSRVPVIDGVVDVSLQMSNVSSQMSMYWWKLEFGVNIQCADITVSGAGNLGNLVPFHQ